MSYNVFAYGFVNPKLGASASYVGRDALDVQLDSKGGFRRQTIKSASRLSISGTSPSISGRSSRGVVGRVLEMLGSRVSISQGVRPCVLRHRVTHYTLCPSYYQK